MRFLLTSAGIKNASIHNALVDLLGKPIAASSALCIPTAIYPFPGGASMAYRLISGSARSPLCELGWQSLGVLELTALPSIKEEYWTAAVQEADALLVGGGDPMYLCHWMRQSGLADLLPSLRREMVYVGVSAGSMVTASTFGETYPDRSPLSSKAGWDWLILRCFRTWITPICRILPWPTQNDGPPRCPCRGMRSTIRPPSKWLTAPSKSSPKGTGSCLPPNVEKFSGFARDLWPLWLKVGPKS